MKSACLPSVCSVQYGLYIFCSLCRWTECSTQSNYTQSSGRSVQALFVFWPGFSCALLATHSCMASLLANSTACWLCTRQEQDFNNVYSCKELLGKVPRNCQRKKPLLLLFSKAQFFHILRIIHDVKDMRFLLGMRIDQRKSQTFQFTSVKKPSHRKSLQSFHSNISNTLRGIQQVLF